MSKINELISGILIQNKLDISKSISIVENSLIGNHELLSQIYQFTGNAHRIGITGPPGSGKSSLTDRLIKSFTDLGKTVAIIGIDPSSPFTDGAFLGDRIRMMKHFDNPNVFIRSMATRGSLGGLAKKSREVADIFDASGYDLIIFETVGVGQIELDVMNATDSILVVLVPESGDDIQMMKSGLMEIADLFVINKADRDGTNKLFTALNQVLSLRNNNTNWSPIIQKTSATQNKGITKLTEEIINHYNFILNNGELKNKAEKRYSHLTHQLISQKHRIEFWNEKKRNTLTEQLKMPIIKRKSPYQLSDEIYNK
jgi:LAO/AO transport system kinase